jgi:uncharacterized protein (TIGR03435 family)
MVGRIALLFVIGSSVVVTELAAQTSTPSFEVASIKRSARPLGGGSIGVQPGGRFSAVNMPLSTMIEWAYGVRQPQLIDAPDWVKNETFDVNAKPAGEVPRAETLLMLRSLLAERFKLVLKTEQRELAVQELSRIREDGQLGPRLVKLTSDAPDACRNMLLPPQSDPPGALSVRRCGNPGEIIGRTNFLAFQALTVDKTGLTGEWAVSLFFAPEGELTRRGAPADPNLPSLSTAIQEQLFLRLRRTRALMDVLVIQSVERPTED